MMDSYANILIQKENNGAVSYRSRLFESYLNMEEKAVDHEI